MLPFFMARFQQYSTGCKTEGKIIERSRPYHISLDGKFPLIYFFSPGPLIIQDRQCTVHGCENGNNLMQQIKWIN